MVPSALMATLVPLISPSASPSISDPSCVQTLATESCKYTRTCPDCSPLPLVPFGAPMATMFPSELISRLTPKLSKSDSPSISFPNCTQGLSAMVTPCPKARLYTRTCPASSPFPSFPGAPIATIVPPALMAILLPLISHSASPSISFPICCHEANDTDTIEIKNTMA